MRKLLRRDKKNLLITKIQKNINSLPIVKKKSFYISRNSILKEHQKSGFGQILLKRIISENKKFKNLSLHVNKKNKSGKNLYRKYGFINVSSKKNYNLFIKRI